MRQKAIGHVWQSPVRRSQSLILKVEKEGMTADCGVVPATQEEDSVVRASSLFRVLPAGSAWNTSSERRPDQISSLSRLLWMSELPRVLSPATLLLSDLMASTHSLWPSPWQPCAAGYSWCCSVSSFRDSYAARKSFEVPVTRFLKDALNYHHRVVWRRRDFLRQE